MICLIEHTERDKYGIDLYKFNLYEDADGIRSFDCSLEMEYTANSFLASTINRLLDNEVKGKWLQTFFTSFRKAIGRIPGIEKYYLPKYLLDERGKIIPAEYEIYKNICLTARQKREKIIFEPAKNVELHRTSAVEFDEKSEKFVCRVHRFLVFRVRITRNPAGISVHVFVIKSPKNDFERITVYCTVIGNSITSIYWSKHRVMDRQTAVFAVEIFIRNYLTANYGQISR
jgi:hypothetical protein